MRLLVTGHNAYIGSVMVPVLRTTTSSGGRTPPVASAQLHSTVPNTSGHTRFSVDFRTVTLDDVAADREAPNIDPACTGTTMGDSSRGWLFPAWRRWRGHVTAISGAALTPRQRLRSLVYVARLCYWTWPDLYADLKEAAEMASRRPPALHK